MRQFLAPIASVMSWLAPALIVLALVITSNSVKSRLTLPAALVSAIWLAALATSLFNLVYFIIL